MSDSLGHSNDEEPQEIKSGRCANKNLSSPIRQSKDENNKRQSKSSQENFVYVLEEQLALFDSTPYLAALEKKMEANTAEINEVWETTLTPNTNNLSLKKDATMRDRIISDRSCEFATPSCTSTLREDKVDSDSDKKTFYTDADVLNAICSHSNDPDSRLVLERVLSGTRTRKCSEMKKQDNHVLAQQKDSVEYWSDEEYRYPPQMSLSPPPGQILPKKTTLKEKKSDEKEPRKNSLTHGKESKHSSNTSHFKKRQLTKTLSPIVVKLEHHRHQTISSLTEKTALNATPHRVNTRNICPIRTTSYQYNNWKSRDSDDHEPSISSPSLIRPTLGTPPTTRKEMSPIDPLSLIAGHRAATDTLFEFQRSVMPKRQVSRSQSSTNDTTSFLFPEIPTIKKTQGTSKSISDFRQSSSIFGKFVQKNPNRGSSDEKREAKTDKPGKGTNTQAASSSRNKMGESAKRKIRRILSLN